MNFVLHTVDSVDRMTLTSESTTNIHSIALDRALASLTGFMTVRFLRCGVISPTINLILAT
jgi:hypothetical protein